MAGWNAYETGLFFQCLPNKTAAFEGEECHGGKQSKLRVTVLLATNESGKEKLPPPMIGLSKKAETMNSKRAMTDEDIVANINAEISDEGNEELDQQEHKKVP
ncbi:hypothetical protein AVEN_160917-1 [Araneus ventricosus]|uniref:DDE-1 domain-containing protein n=1 Tax=Araneus ventricosus TaxID=182803 RepID=A0A4Y2LP41_ARAVE|nr:hypothetical protein AVEN_160917-1 [Araneus ventricosus]